MDEQLTFEQARDELLEIVRRLDQGEVSLQDSLDLWQRGESLVARCELLLNQAQAMFDQVVDGASPAGEATTSAPPGPGA